MWSMEECKNKIKITKYAYYYFSTGEMKLVSRVAFKKGNYPVIRKEAALIKLVSPQVLINKKQYMYLFHELNKVHYKPEGIIDEIGDTWTVIRHFMKLCSNIMTIKDKIKNFGLNGLASILELFMTINDIFTNGFSMVNVVKICLRIYDLLGKTLYKPEMLEELIISSAMAFNIFPKPIKAILVNLQLLTSNKICEDITVIHKILQCIINLVKKFLEMLPTCDLVDKIIKIVDSFLDDSIHGQVKIMLEEVSKKNIQESLVSSVYRDRIVQIYGKLDHLKIKDWGRKSPSVLTIYNDFVNLYKRVLAINENSRVEPVAFIFEGPPGCGKSHAMSRVLEVFRKGSYCHTVKCTKDGKDFYDGYNNEPIFYMDDVGQQGNSQWRTIINMVSEVKYPLDCAQANMKDMKFFNSEIIMATTNAFMNFPPLTKDDCITDIRALWRRCFVFDFYGLKFVNGIFEGDVVLRHFPVGGQGFKTGLPHHLLKQFMDLNPNFKFEFKCQGDNLKFYGWIYTIINTLNKMASDRFSANALSDDEVLRARQAFGAEVLTPPWTYRNDGTETVQPTREFTENFDDGLNIPTYVDVLERYRDQLPIYRRRMYEDYEPEQRNTWVWFDTIKEVLTTVIGGFVDYITDQVTKLGSSKTLYIVLILLLGIGGLYVFNKGLSKTCVDLGGFIAEGNSSIKNSFSEDMSTVEASIVKNLREIRLQFDNGRYSNCIGLFSGHMVVVPCHAVLDDVRIYLTTFKSKELNHIMYDKIPVEIIYRDFGSDTAILRLPRTMASVMKNLSHLIGNVQPTKVAKLLSPFGVYAKVSPQTIPKHSPVVYKIPYIDNQLKPVDEIAISGDVFTYKIHGNGLCGSIVSQGGIVGMHVAGSDSANLGLSVRWDAPTLELMRRCFAEDSAFQYPSGDSDKILNDSSVLKLEENKHVSVGSKTNFVPTHLYGMYPIEREPANLVKYGKCTVKDIAKKSFGQTTFVDPTLLAFGKAVMERMLSGYKHATLNPKEIIKGTDWLAGLNKDSSNGYKCKRFKTDYINFETSEFLEDFKMELEIFEQGIRLGRPDWDKMVWVEALKDELRNVEKEGEPRSFRVGTIHHQVLMKKHFGTLVEFLMKRRDENGIMVGINPIVEWPRMYDTLKSCKGIFAGDIAKWDGSMNNMVQDTIKAVIVEATGDDLVVDFLLENAIRSLVAVQDDTYITTHSMPSGHYLTAILNSLVNRFYSALWYAVNHKFPTVEGFFRDVVDYVYGDDKLVGIRNSVEELNAVTMEAFFSNMGMGFTDALKRPIKTPFQDISEVTFLKRYFRYHNILKKIVCPLELKTLYSGLNFYDSSKDYEVVLRDKISAFQREIYLWPNRDELLQEFKIRMKLYKTDFVELDKEYLYSLYQKPEDYVLTLMWGGTQYI